MKQTSVIAPTIARKAKPTQFFLAVGVVVALAYAGMYLMAMSPLLIRALMPVLAGR